MDEIDLPKKNIPSIDSENLEEIDEGTERVFDISNDTISLVTNDEAPQNVPAFKMEKKPIVVKPLQTPVKPDIQIDTENLLDKKIGTFEASPFAAPLAKPVQVPQPGETVLVKNTSSAIPLQDISANINKFRTGPANPVTKNVVGTFTGSLDKKPPAQSLQDSVSNVLGETHQFGPDARSKSSQNSPGTIPLSEAITNSTSPIKNPELYTDNNLKPLRTYESDVAEVMSHKRPSMASIAIAESKKEEGEESLSSEAPSHAVRNILMICISLIFLGGGTFGAFYLYSRSPLGQPKAKP
nr:hypothetical protein [bacterium]